MIWTDKNLLMKLKVYKNTKAKFSLEDVETEIRKRKALTIKLLIMMSSKMIMIMLF